MSEVSKAYVIDDTYTNCREINQHRIISARKMKVSCLLAEDGVQ